MWLWCAFNFEGANLHFFSGICTWVWVVWVWLLFLLRCTAGTAKFSMSVYLKPGCVEMMRYCIRATVSCWSLAPLVSCCTLFIGSEQAIFPQPCQQVPTPLSGGWLLLQLWLWLLPLPLQRPLLHAVWVSALPPASGDEIPPADSLSFWAGKSGFSFLPSCWKLEPLCVHDKVPPTYCVHCCYAIWLSCTWLVVFPQIWGLCAKHWVKFKFRIQNTLLSIAIITIKQKFFFTHTRDLCPASDSSSSTSFRSDYYGYCTVLTSGMHD